LEGKGSNYQSDIYAIGVIYYHMLFSAYPFPASTRGELREKLKEGKLIIDTSKLTVLSAEFLLGALQYNMEDRYKEKHLIESPLGNIPFDKMKKFEKAEMREFSTYKKYRVNDKYNDLKEIE
jgi:serine/threonine protein kinase